MLGFVGVWGRGLCRLPILAQSHLELGYAGMHVHTVIHLAVRLPFHACGLLLSR